MRKYIFVVVLVLMASGTQAATLNVDGGTGQLLGASGVDVGGTLYSVEFLDGTCIDLYNGFAAAGLASQALLDQVFSDSPSGNFDAVPVPEPSTAPPSEPRFNRPFVEGT